MSEAIRMNNRTCFCEGWNHAGVKRTPCDGGSGVWVTRRARWERDGYLQCGTCKKHDDERLKEES